MNLNGIYYDFQSYWCQKFRTPHFNEMFSMSVKFNKPVIEKDY